MNYDSLLKSVYDPKDEVSFTEAQYFSKNDIAEKLGGQISEASWLQVSKYRDKYYKYLPLKSFVARSISDKLKYFWPKCFWTKLIHANELSNAANAKILSKLEISQILNKNFLKNLKKENTFKEIKVILEVNGLSIEEKDFWEVAANDTDEGLNNNQKMALGLYRVLGSLDKANIPPYNEELLKKWNLWIFGDESLPTRSNRLSDSTGINVSGFPTHEIDTCFYQLVNFINDKYNDFVFVKVAAAFAFIRLGHLFDNKVNDFFGLFTIYYIFAQHFSNTFSYLNIAEQLLTTNLNSLVKAIENVQKNNADINYILNVILDSFIESLNNLIPKLDEIQLSHLKDEVKTTISINNFVEGDLTNRKGVKLNQTKQNIEILMNKFPVLTVRQASFYLDHKDIKMFYSIKDFQKFTDSCQETARYSLDELVSLGFYTKEKVSKKFVYKPSEIDMLKG